MLGFKRSTNDPTATQRYAPSVLAVVQVEYAGAYPTTRTARLRTALVTGLSKTKGGELELIVHIDGINLPKRFKDSEVIDVLYINEAAASAAIAALA